MEAPDVQITGINYRPLEVDDFSGGKTDYYIGAPMNKFKEGDNLVLIKYGQVGKLVTRPGSQIYDATYYQIPAGIQRIGSYKYFNSNLFIQSANKLYFINSGWSTLVGPVTSNNVFPATVDTTAVWSYTTWAGHLLVANDMFSKPQKIFKDSGGTWRLRTAGLPALASNPTVTAGGAGAQSYVYRFIHYYTYTVGTQTFIDRGTAVEVSLTAALAPDVSAVAITGIPVLANGATNNYDTATIQIEIYRTTTGGVNFYRVGAVTNGTTIFNDSVSDTTLQNNEPLYTEGGNPDNDEPPLCKVVHVVDDKAYYGHIKIGSAVYPTRGCQSIPGDIDSVPGTFFFEVQDAIVGISSVRSSPICLCENFIYRLDSAFDELGRGSIIPQKISDTAGCLSSQSIVQTTEGIFWAGIDGFYFSDGYRVQRVSGSLDNSYKLLIATTTQQKRIFGKLDTKKKRIWWAVQGEGATDCDSCYILDLNWPLSEDMPFTTASGGSNFNPTAIEFISGNLVRGDKSGYTFLHSDTVYTDPVINTAVVPSTWEETHIEYNYVSAATNFGSSYLRKWVPRIVVNCKDETNLSMQILSINDDYRQVANLKPIRTRGNITWGDPDIYWGDESVTWNGQGIIDETRRFPAKNIRCEYKQVQFTNAFVAIISSDVLGTAAVNSTTKTVVLDNAAVSWPDASVGYYISFAFDSYTTNYLITAVTSTTITYQDTANTSSTGSAQSWVIRGYPKGEVMYLIDYCIFYAFLGQTQIGFGQEPTGEVGD